MITNQFLLFLLYLAIGFCCSIIFDIFRSLRKSIKTSNIATYIEDLIFWILIGIILIITISTFSLGELRFYFFISIVVGFIIYYSFFSKYILKFNVSILNIAIKIYNKICYFFSHTFMKPVKFIIINLRKILIIKKIRKKEGF